MVKKWQKIAAFGRRRIMSTRTSGDAHSKKWRPSLANKGHVFVYSSDGKRFTVPLGYRNHDLFRKLFTLSEEVYGLPSDGPLTLPCDASSMAYFISMYRNGTSVDVERTMPAPITGDRCSIFHVPCQLRDQQLHILYGF